ncbi:MAG: DUF3108 domain-containing protein [Candidatus Omnitrophica bacterium]|nr:DUF3108 domain-containing protein [Candidatus Omnitrophota bacterium]
MRAIIIFIFLVLSAASLSAAQSAAPAKAFYPGEKITYNIKKMFVVGEATLEYKGLTEIEGKPAELIIFRAKAPAFFDEEKIYFDPQTFYPLKNFRDLDIFGKKQKIEETYFQDQNRVEIVDRSLDKSRKVEFKKTSSIDNVYGIIYRFRMKGDATLGAQLHAVLPTKEVNFTIAKEGNIKVNHQNQKALFMAGEPKNFGFWFSADDRRIPLRINGALGSMSAVMEFKSICDKLCGGDAK